jgi:hypothetical protein
MAIIQKRGGTVFFFAGASEGDSLADLSRSLMAPFSPVASRTVLLELSNPDWFEKFKEMLNEPIWFAASYFGSGQEIAMSQSGKSGNLWDMAGIPFVRFFGDIPAYFPDRHMEQFANSINAYSDIDHVAFYRRWFRSPCLSVVHPRILQDPAPVDQVAWKAKLNGKIIFPKNGNPPLQLITYWREQLPPPICHALESIAEECIGKDLLNHAPHFDDRVLAHFSSLGIDASAKPELVCFLVAQLDDYLRRIKSTMIAEALLNLPVIIRGRNWEHVSFEGKAATYDPESGSAETVALIDHSPAVIDMSPNTVHSPHDRICRAVGRNTAFLTNSQEYFDSTLGALAPKCTFSFELEAIQSMVEHFVLHPKDAIDLGVEQSKLLRPALSEANYLNSILGAVDSVSFSKGSRPPGTQGFLSFPPKVFH